MGLVGRSGESRPNPAPARLVPSVRMLRSCFLPINGSGRLLAPYGCRIDVSGRLVASYGFV